MGGVEAIRLISSFVSLVSVVLGRGFFFSVTDAFDVACKDFIKKDRIDWILSGGLFPLFAFAASIHHIIQENREEGDECQTEI